MAEFAVLAKKSLGEREHLAVNLAAAPQRNVAALLDPGQGSDECLGTAAEHPFDEAAEITLAPLKLFENGSARRRKRAAGR